MGTELRWLSPEEAEVIFQRNFDACSDDNSDINAKAPDSWMYLGNDYCACAFQPLGEGDWEVHIASIERGHGKKIMKDAIEKMRDFGATRIIGMPPEYNIPAIKCCIYAGMVVDGITEGTFLKNGVRYNQVKLVV